MIILLALPCWSFFWDLSPGVRNRAACVAGLSMLFFEEPPRDGTQGQTTNELPLAIKRLTLAQRQEETTARNEHQ